MPRLQDCVLLSKLTGWTLSEVDELTSEEFLEAVEEAVDLQIMMNGGERRSP
jgi:uncharacterized protein